MVFREVIRSTETARTGTLQGVSAGGNFRISGTPLGARFSLALTPVLARACSGDRLHSDILFDSFDHEKKN